MAIPTNADYEVMEAAELRNLVVCKSDDLPHKEEREKYSVYFVYDKMQLFVFQSLYSDPFCVVESLNPQRSFLTDKMVYITMDGEIYTYSTYKVIRLGFTTNTEYLDLLSQCGSFFFMNYRSRYVDKQFRTIQLPFQDGHYTIALSLPEDARIDKDTVIRYDEEKEQFYIAGKEYQFEDKLNNLYRYSGLISKTVVNNVTDKSFESKIRLSSDLTNSIKSLNNGLYVSTYDLANKAKYEEMLLHFSNYKRKINHYLDELIPVVEQASEDVTPEKIDTNIREILESYDEDIMDLLEDYITYKNRIEQIDAAITASDSNIEQTKREIIEYINSIQSPWVYLGDSVGANDSISDPNSQIVNNEALAMVLSEFRSNIRNMREYSDTSNIHSSGIIKDAETAKTGLTIDETSLQDFVVNSFKDIAYNLDNKTDSNGVDINV